jgi:hypothetical protein
MPPSQREMSPQAAAVRIPARSCTLEILDQQRRHARARRLQETVAPSGGETSRAHRVD